MQNHVPIKQQANGKFWVEIFSSLNCVSTNYTIHHIFVLKNDYDQLSLHDFSWICNSSRHIQWFADANRPRHIKWECAKEIQKKFWKTTPKINLSVNRLLEGKYLYFYCRFLFSFSFVFFSFYGSDSIRTLLYYQHPEILHKPEIVKLDSCKRRTMRETEQPKGMCVWNVLDYHMQQNTQK